ncbi:hypothetical protein FPF71_05390 [Algibacter amylolyticus]|uniref:Uncharacterized protein n=1 Tax=Algibacter amylolyticus TaxID=1608400 RepID=A0A5M7B9Z9_9FLAO|nr:hypothetical protein [Algibacter amylolyticus]KAA5826249.1 hypothetical protein F2B50_05390 [Algibacter amylolyticus]MBB5268452.1 hypothetical protein [Algibacter amylolyticus]TSJ80287.1 hypothetical protein FPF71_05390 [Algibacter amylolyticus]
MLAYAVRFKINEIVLYYPNMLSTSIEGTTEINITDEFAKDENIQIRACQLPIINRELFKKDIQNKQTLQLEFEAVKIELIGKIEASLKFI